jgi:uncharacterized membrane protein YadS
MAYLYHRENTAPTEARPSFLALFPLFILGFLAMALVRTLGDLTLPQAWGIFSAAEWGEFVKGLQQISEALLAVAMAAVGLSTRLQALRTLGLRPFYVGFGAAVAVGGLSLGGIVLLRLLNAYG